MIDYGFMLLLVVPICCLLVYIAVELREINGRLRQLENLLTSILDRLYPSFDDRSPKLHDLVKSIKEIIDHRLRS